MIVLDTHVWLWWLSESPELSAPAKAAIDRAQAGGRVVISTISTWEVALLIARGRLRLRLPVEEWIAASEAVDAIDFVSPTNRVMLESVALPGDFHADPADRIIVATARVAGLPIVTKDTTLRAYPHVETIW